MSGRWESEKIRLALAAITLGGGLSGCSPGGDGVDPGALGITTTSTIVTTSMASEPTTATDPGATTLDGATSTTTDAPLPTLDPGAAASRLSPGNLAPTRYATSAFAYDLTIDLHNGTWSTDEDTRTAIHLAQAPEPDFASSESYDFPLLVLIAMTDTDDDALIGWLDELESVRFVGEDDTEVDGRPTVVRDGASRDNPFIPLFTGPNGEPFAGLGGYWYWDPDLVGLLYRVWIVDMGGGTMIAWYSAPRSAFENAAKIATAAVESIRFLR